jgi:competence protein ComK
MNFKELKWLDKYEVNPYTMGIFPILVDGKLYSRVFEVEMEFGVRMKPINIIDYSCCYYGCSFSGRKKGTRQLIGITHKPPIIMEATTGIFLFPTASPSRPDCAWLSHSHILPQTSGTSPITISFTNNQQIQLEMSKGSFQNQLFNTAQLKTTLDSRTKEKANRMNFFIDSSRRKVELIYQDFTDYDSSNKKTSE